MRTVNIQVWSNNQAQDWSVEINGTRHEHISSQIVEDLVECAIIVAERQQTEKVIATGLAL
jgi:hypothetical protein